LSLRKRKLPFQKVPCSPKTERQTLCKSRLEEASNG
jgi:hypothetical protein